MRRAAAARLCGGRCAAARWRGGRRAGRARPAAARTGWQPEGVRGRWSCCRARREGRVVSAEELLERVWDEMADPFTTAVKVTVSRLRRKLGDPPVIETLAQAG